MTDALDQILERARQNRAARRTNVDIQVSKPVSAEQRLGSTFLAGARVADTLSGQGGVVVLAHRQHAIVPAARPSGPVPNASSFQLPDSKPIDLVVVELDDRTIVTRTPDQLIARPTPPNGGK
jgi:hypothetical protein